jgi:hypothetical protein
LCPFNLVNYKKCIDVLRMRKVRYTVWGEEDEATRASQLRMHDIDSPIACTAELATDDTDKTGQVSVKFVRGIQHAAVRGAERQAMQSLRRRQSYGKCGGCHENFG